MIITIDTEDPEIRDILSRPCFACIAIAKRLREGGQAIGQRAEAEQSAVLVWMLEQKATGGETWEKDALQKLRDMNPSNPRPFVIP